MKITYSLENIDQAVAFVLQHATSKVMLFDAEMGTGKTTLIKALVKALGCSDAVSSPTFSLVNEYLGEHSKLYHFDLYRIEETNELYDFGIETYFEENAYVFVEWPQLLEPILDVDYQVIKISLDVNLNSVLELEKTL